MLKRSAFLVGFMGSLLTFVGLNVATYIAVRDCCRESSSDFLTDSIAMGGFPFPWFSNGTFKLAQVDWFALKINLVIAVVASLAIGKISQFVFGKPVPINPNVRSFG
jgi:hypothetical protein